MPSCSSSSMADLRCFDSVVLHPARPGTFTVHDSVASGRSSKYFRAVWAGSKTVHFQAFATASRLRRRSLSKSWTKKWDAPPSVQPLGTFSACNILAVARDDTISGRKHVSQLPVAAPIRQNAGDGTSAKEERSALVAARSVPHTLFGRNLPAVHIATSFAFPLIVCALMALGFLTRPKVHARGSVSDLVRRGQLRSDRKANSSKALKYEDPFNNPLVKKEQRERMHGKHFRLEPVTLTEEEVMSHQNRRTQAYRWKRPIIFLNEGDPVPDGVDPEEVRWIPSNHPFATTNTGLDENIAQQNVYQTRGVPFRVRAEYEALRRRAKADPQNGIWMALNVGTSEWNETSDISKGEEHLGKDAEVK